jgi:hypothetical protein
VVVGDSRIRQLFCALLEYASDEPVSKTDACASAVRRAAPHTMDVATANVNGPSENNGNGPSAGKSVVASVSSSNTQQTTMRYDDDDLLFASAKNRLRIEFLNRPLLDEALRNEIDAFADESVSERPTLIVITNGLAALLRTNWSAMMTSSSSKQPTADERLVSQLRENVTALIKSIDHLARTKAFWMLQGIQSTRC